MAGSADTPGHYEARNNRVMDHVRNNLDGDLSLGVLAGVAHFSPFHFHRLFKSVTGQTVTEFTQRARLERAAYLMQASPQRQLGSIALEVGFSAQSDFARVFRYGMAPSGWDRRSRLDPQVVVDDYERIIAAERRAHPPAAAALADHRACRIAYVRTRAPFLGEPLRRGYEQLTAWLGEHGVDWRGAALIGMSWDNYETTPIDQVTYDLGFEVPAGVAAEGAVGIHVLPAHRAVQVHCRGPLSCIAVAWDHLYQEWLPASSYEPDDLPAMKRFRTRPDELGWEQWDVDCSIAVRPRRP